MASRDRARQPRGLPLLLTRIVIRVVHFIMQRKQLLGIKRRAESTPASAIIRQPVHAA
jgi:hypothetical protein